MPITLGTNIASLKGQRQLARSSSQLSTVFERLSSGQRINRASDDAAGLAIADTLSADARVYAQGVRNLNDGVSLLNIADAAIENLSGIVVRLQELAEQSANGVYGDVQRQALDQEAQALSEEYFRIIQTTEFNGQKLLTGETPVITLQAGRGDNATLDASVGGAIGTGEFGSTATLNSQPTAFDVVTADFNGDGNIDIISGGLTEVRLSLGDGNGGFSSSTSILTPGVREVVADDFNNDGTIDILTANGTDLSLHYGNGDGTFQTAVTSTLSQSINNFETGDFNNDGIQDVVFGTGVSNRHGVALGNGDGTFTEEYITVAVSNGNISIGDFNNDGNLDVSQASLGARIYYGDGTGSLSTSVSLDGINLFEGVLSADVNGDGLLDVIAANNTNDEIDIFFGLTGSTFSSATSYSVGTEAKDIEFQDIDGDGIKDILVAEYQDNGFSVLIGNGDGTFQDAQFTLAGISTDEIALDDFNNDGVLDIASGGLNLYLNLGETTSGVAPLLEFSLATTAEARQALPQFQQKLDQLAQQRGEIGANLSRIDVATDVLTISAENFRAAESRIRDADIASETANLVRLNILQQAAASVLSQANQQPQLALQLLRGGP